MVSRKTMTESQLLDAMSFAAAFGGTVAAEVLTLDTAHPNDGGCSAGTTAGALADLISDIIGLEKVASHLSWFNCR